MATLTRRRLRFVWRYVRGNTPWDSGIVPPEIVAWIEAAESSGSTPGRALDLGCGTGTTSIYLAAHGWDVLGVDFAPNAVWRARRKARRRGRQGSVAFLSADVSRPDFLPETVPFDLVVDVGCLHSLAPDQRAAYAAHLARLARPGAAYLLYAFMPRLSRDGKRQMGIDLAGLRALLVLAFELVDCTLGEEATSPIPSGWYTFRRAGDRS
ncbi:MAG TPA: class I SAM-dependent methyltransferase [Aggregatilineaceae bacterium]|nr:class I SAM-dependent methyltransferase [Aggregatilineaceae bacterium]